MIKDTSSQSRWTRGLRARNLDALGPCLYAARTPDGCIKIGWSSALGNRLKQLGGHGALIAVRLNATRADEKAIHTSLRGHAIKGREWYPETPEVMAVVNSMRADVGLPAI